VPAYEDGSGLSQTPRRSCPSLNLRPQPDVSIGQSGHRRGERLMASAPIVDHLRPRHTQSTRYLNGIDQIVDVHLSAHEETVRAGYDTPATANS